MSVEATTPAAPAARRLAVVPAWMRGYRRAWLRPDLGAGVIVGSVVIPQAVA